MNNNAHHDINIDSDDGDFLKKQLKDYGVFLEIVRSQIGNGRRGIGTVSMAMSNMIVPDGVETETIVAKDGSWSVILVPGNRVHLVLPNEKVNKPTQKKSISSVEATVVTARAGTQKRVNSLLEAKPQKNVDTLHDASSNTLEINEERKKAVDAFRADLLKFVGNGISARTVRDLVEYHNKKWDEKFGDAEQSLTAAMGDKVEDPSEGWQVSFSYWSALFRPLGRIDPLRQKRSA